MQLHSLTLKEMRDGLLAKTFSAEQLCQAHLERIESSNEQFNSFISICPDEARADAEKAQKVLDRDGESSPFFTGLPIAVKDMLVTKGIRTTCASNILGNFIPPYDCTVVAKLKQNGAVILGKTNLDEFAMGSSTEHSAYGPVKNPWDQTRVPGGSSGGSAVAVALGQAPMALGTDTGGSIRQPASLCGVYGLKPTYGRVSRYGAVAFASSLDQIGPFTRSIEDLCQTMEVIAGHDPMDSTSMEEPVPSFTKELFAHDPADLRGLRVGVPKEYFIEGIQTEVEASVRDGIETLAKLGAQIVDVSLPHTEHALSAYYILAPAEASSNLSRYDGVRYGHRAKDVSSLREMYEKTRAEGFGDEVKRRIMIGTYVLSTGYYDAYYKKAQQVRTLIIDDFKSAFANHCDLIVTPVAPTTAFKIGENLNDPLQMYLADIFTIPPSLAGLPGLSMPVGNDESGLPIGLQLLGAPFNESLLMRVGYALEKQFGFEVNKQCQ